MELVIQILKKANAAANIVIRSTVPPGTSKSLGVSFMPEFLTEANANKDFCNNSLWILGDGDSIKLQQLLTNAKSENIIVFDKLEQMSSTEAEMVKYVRNAFLSVKVSFFNEVFDACEVRGCNFEAVRTAVGADDVWVIRLYPVQMVCVDLVVTVSLKMWQHGVPLMKQLIQSAARRRNLELDRPEKDWEKDKGIAVV